MEAPAGACSFARLPTPRRFGSVFFFFLLFPTHPPITPRSATDIKFMEDIKGHGKEEEELIPPGVSAVLACLACCDGGGGGGDGDGEGGQTERTSQLIRETPPWPPSALPTPISNTHPHPGSSARQPRQHVLPQRHGSGPEGCARPQQGAGHVLKGRSHGERRVCRRRHATRAAPRSGEHPRRSLRGDGGQAQRLGHARSLRHRAQAVLPAVCADDPARRADAARR